MAQRPTIQGIEASPDVLGGKPTIAGTRIGVDIILDKISDGETIEEILQDYPRLTREQVVAAIRYAAYLVRTASA